MPKKSPGALRTESGLRALVDRRGAVARLRAVGCSIAQICQELGISRPTVCRDLKWLQESGHASVASSYLTEIYDLLYLMVIDGARENDWRKVIQLSRCMVDVDKHNSGGALTEILETATMAAVAERYAKAAIEIGQGREALDAVDGRLPLEIGPGEVIAGSVSAPAGDAAL